MVHPSPGHGCHGEQFSQPPTAQVRGTWLQTKYFLVISPPFKRQFDKSPPSVSSLLNHCLDKGTASAPARSPSYFMTLDSLSSSVREGAIADPSHSTSSIKKPSSSQPKVEEDDVDVLVFCPKCQRYRVFEHYCMFPRYLSPEL
ncbi:hypothetical protein M422DRAFT_264302 [Sphaerobolus stellatus SS14]|uniref:Uncharacterized protein n=1 Tax=Sphaerobolus stellatus (strain SS14) TaxID=990650 RepID=A0A0C9UWM9_SPHS4|nr:hypothetical protein M422DRAFT_264302 [Sphaerobolus stellatus SS14]